jgi:predicted transcriptional regulator
LFRGGLVKATGTADHQDVTLRFVERFALMLVDSGLLPRMPARVFAYVLVDDAERYSAAELASGLRVSPAAISGAVRHLVQLGYLSKEHVPGQRSDTYRIYDEDVWGTITLQQLRINRAYEEVAMEGVRSLGTDTPGGRRMYETLQFHAFLRRELPELIERWRAQRRSLASGAG